MFEIVRKRTISNREFRDLLGISETYFRQLRRAGTFDHLASPIRGRWSLDKIEAWLRSTGPQDLSSMLRDDPAAEEE